VISGARVWVLSAVSHRHVIAPPYMAAAVSRAVDTHNGERACVPLLEGWRREAIGEALLAALQGRATARISPDTQRVHLDGTKEPRFERRGGTENALFETARITSGSHSCRIEHEGRLYPRRVRFQRLCADECAPRNVQELIRLPRNPIRAL
jgi:hypothetical protein